MFSVARRSALSLGSAGGGRRFSGAEVVGRNIFRGLLSESLATGQRGIHEKTNQTASKIENKGINLLPL